MREGNARSGSGQPEHAQGGGRGFGMDETTIGEVRPEEIPEADAVDDVEGHNLLLDPELRREMARAREAEIERRLQVHEVLAEAKRPQDAPAKK